MEQTYIHKSGGGSGYLTPEITIIEIAAEQGFAQSGKVLDDIHYDNSWENANQ